MSQVGSLRVEAILENVPVAVDYVAHIGQVVGVDETTLYQIQVAVDEACANVVQHAYAGMEPGEMEILCHVDNNSFIISIRDWGNTFDPDEVSDPDISSPLEERSLGGLGLFFMRQYMDEISFSSDPEAGNELTMVKRRTSAA
jgi:serine/threonine-protein kinase RsbW